MPYTEFEDLLAEGRLSEITVGDTMVTGKLQAPLRGKTTVAANRVEPDVAEPLAKAAYSQAPVMP